jgi:hypothetical protein
MILLAALAALAPAALFIQDSEWQVPGSPSLIGPSVPAPEAVMGRRFASRHSTIADVERYFRAVAEASPRVRLERHGWTPEGRPMLHAFVSSPENLARLDAIQEENRRLFFQPSRVQDDELARMKLVVWAGYGVHGNEHSATEASIAFLHQLAAAKDAEIEAILDRTVIIIVPSLNPDGRDRSVNWMNGVRGQIPTADPQDREHREPWPTGRTNRYGFDLNRDWMPLTQQETRQRHAVWTAWRPQVTLDFHEMGSDLTFFFQPGVASRVNPWTPDSNQELTTRLAFAHQSALEEDGKLFFSGERYDDYYIGKGSTYPDLLGSVGILFEQASSRAMLRPAARSGNPDGILRYEDTVRNQLTASWSSLRGADAMSEELRRHMRDRSLEAVSGRFDPGWAALRWPEGADEDSGWRLAQLLARHEIDVFTRQNGGAAEYLAPARQPAARLLAAMFDRPREFEDDEFYDISAWPLDLAHGFEAERLGSAPALAGWTQVEPGEKRIGMANPLAAKGAAAIILPWRSVRDAARAARLLEQGLPLHRATARMPISPERTLAPGEIVVPMTPAVEALIEKAGLGEGSFETVARNPQFLRSLGGGNIVPIPRLRAAIAFGEGVNVNDAGAVWQLMDQKLGLAVSAVEPAVLASGSLESYTAVVLASGSYSEALAAKLLAWMRQGGTLICAGSAMDWASRTGLWDLRARTPQVRVADLPYGEIAGERGRQEIPGSVFEIGLDATHPLAWGLPGRLWTMRDSNAFYDLPSQPGSVVARYSDKPLAAGYASPEAIANAPGRSAVLARREGQGALILIADIPHFRAFFTASDMLFVNSLFFGRQI